MISYLLRNGRFFVSIKWEITRKTPWKWYWISCPLWIRREKINTSDVPSHLAAAVFLFAHGGGPWLPGAGNGTGSRGCGTWMNVRSFLHNGWHDQWWLLQGNLLEFCCQLLRVNPWGFRFIHYNKTKWLCISQFHWYLIPWNLASSRWQGNLHTQIYEKFYRPGSVL